MTILEAAKDILFVTGGQYNVGFNGDDETQFDVDNISELEECWIGFCKENGFDPNSVDYVECV